MPEPNPQQPQQPTPSNPQQWWFGPNSLWGQLFPGMAHNSPQTPQNQPGQGPEPYTPTAWGEPPTQTPGLMDIISAMYGDWARAQGLDEENFARRQGALGEFGQAIGDFYGQQRGDANQNYQAGQSLVEGMKADLLRGSQTAATGARGEYGAALRGLYSREGQGLRDISAGLDRVRQQFADFKLTLGGERKYLEGKLGGVYERGATAMAEFRNMSVEKMASWQAGTLKRNEQMKEQRAAQLSAQGYRPDEIQAELSRMDWDAGIEQAEQTYRFQTEEESARRELQFGYDQLSTSAEQTVMNIRSMLSGMEGTFGQAVAGMEAAGGAAKAQLRMQTAQGAAQLHDLTAKVGQWQATIDQATQMGALDASSNFLMAKQQYQSLANTMQLMGETNLATMFQDLEQTFTPFAPLLMSSFAMNLMLEDRYNGYSGSSVALFNAGMGQWQSFVNQATGQLQNA